ncbi:MAG: CRTAC1 family protein [Actinomycetota bacterium]|nr:CRTAC1 family protein [Actinomycetota bacterium]
MTTRAWPRRRTLGAAAIVATIAVAGVVLIERRDSGSATQPSAAPHFVDESTSAGIEHTYTGDFEFFVGGGVATFDCDADGLDELYFAGGAEPAALYRNDSPIGGALQFTEHPSPVTDLTEVTGAYPLDIDSDGLVDLAVLRRGGNVLLRGLGDCEFEDAGEALGIPAGDDWTVAFSATWEADNALPTLAFGSYLVPDSFTCGDSRLLRPATAGDGYADPVALTPGHCTLSVLFSDWSRTGRRDLRVANDRHYYRDGEEQLWQMTPGEAPRTYTADDGWRPLQIWGMGIASHDLTGDGRPEVYITSQGDNKLQSLDDAQGPAYHDIAVERGVNAQRPFIGGDILPSTAWHPEFDDVNNDGFVDLFVSKGNVEAQVDGASKDPSNLLLGTADGTFVEGAEAAGIVNYARARGAALVDLNRDGLLDLVVVNRRENVSLWRNVGAGNATQPEPMGHWLSVRLQQPAPNVDAIGAWLELRVDGRVEAREVTVGGGHAGGSLGDVHLGLGGADAAELRVQWPDGEFGPWMTIDADQHVTIERGAVEPRSDP